MDEDDAWLILAAWANGKEDIEEALSVIRDEYFRRWAKIQELRKKT